MNTENVIKQLQKDYPGKRIIENQNKDGKTTEIICELESSKEESKAIAVIDSSVIHYHKVITETYIVIKGQLTILKYNSENQDYGETLLNEGESISIKPGEIHSNLGNETWIEVISTPKWFIEDFYNLDTLFKKYSVQQ